MALVTKDRREKLIPSDVPWLGAHALIFRRSALTPELNALLLSHGELLPARCADAELVLFNATNIVDALDPAHSDLDRLPNGRIMLIARYAFHPDRIAETDIFKIPDLRVSPTFVSERFVEIATSGGLRCEALAAAKQDPLH